MSLPPPESQQAPEKHLDSANLGANTSLPQVDRIALMKDFKAGDSCPANSLPGLTLVGCEKPGSTAAIDATKPATDAAKPATDAAPDAKAQGIDNAKRALESPDASIKQKMEAMSSLYDNLPKGRDGNVRVTLNDGGKPRDFEISRNDVGKDVHLLQLGTADQHGNSHPVLRAVERHGDVEEQRHANGSKAGFQGDWWSAHEPQSTVAKFGQATRPEGTPGQVTPGSDGGPAGGISARPDVPLPPHRPREHEPGEHSGHQDHDHQRHRRHPQHPTEGAPHQPPEGPPQQPPERTPHPPPEGPTQSRPSAPTNRPETEKSGDKIPPPTHNSEAPVRPQGQTAIYDISTHTVYLPNGERLEAHSGLGRNEDDPNSASAKARGVTPPNTYDLSMRAGLFHGVQALRLNPEAGSNMHGRDGILAHSYMRGQSGQSSGCVVFKNYGAFLRSYEQGQIKRLVVVPHL